EVIKELSEELSIVDLSVEEPDIEDAVSRLYHI
ncbi:MAG: sugar ABC transporter ATP-binding protein, partial [Lachnospiraceae bacterium]|nr:sugar ABC transporter ATP-binding protein [Lachnospiraceae bacterium]